MKRNIVALRMTHNEKMELLDLAKKENSNITNTILKAIRKAKENANFKK